jgi:hypothetical protein
MSLSLKHYGYNHKYHTDNRSIYLTTLSALEIKSSTDISHPEKLSQILDGTLTLSIPGSTPCTPCRITLLSYSFKYESKSPLFKLSIDCKTTVLFLFSSPRLKKMTWIPYLVAIIINHSAWVCFKWE